MVDPEMQPVCGPLTTDCCFCVPGGGRAVCGPLVRAPPPPRPGRAFRT